MKRLNALCVAIGAAIGAAIFAGGAGAYATANATQRTAYWSKDLVVGLAYVITWDTTAHRAHFVETFGHFDGSYVDDGAQRVFTLDTPLTLSYPAADCNGNSMTVTDVTTQLVFRDISGDADQGVSAVVPIGFDQDVGGCTPGRTVSFGTPTDAGVPLFRDAFALRPDMRDLGPGTCIAGLSENPVGAEGDMSGMTAQVATLEREHVRFEGTGHRFPSTLTADGWFVVDYGKFKRAYTRMRKDRETGGETWFGAEWVDGAPASIELTSVVAPTANAGFGQLAESAQQWSDGLFQLYASTTFDLDRDGTGSEVIDAGGDAGEPAGSRPSPGRAAAQT